MTNLLITGKPGVGKTTVVERIVNELTAPVGGFYTREIRERGRRAGFRLATWDGRSGIMSHVGFDSPLRVGKYGVDVRVIDEVGVPAIEQAMALEKMIVIDELGRMELFSERFREAVMMALESPTPVLGVIQDRPHPFLDQIRNRPDVEIFRVTVQNRDCLADRLKNRLTSA